MIANKKQVGKYLIVGIATFVIEYSTFLLLAYTFRLPAWASQAGSYSIAIVFNFILTRNWTFRANTVAAKSQFAKYLLLILINLPLTTLMMNILDIWEVYPFIAKLIVVVLVASWNYIIYDKLIFKNEDRR
jgi:putative flippase GtrA